MLDVQKLIIKAMKKEMFPGHDDLNVAARAVLSEMKTKFVDIREEITAQIQYKMLQKMKKDRLNSVEIYKEAFEKTNSSVAKENLDKAKNELEPIELFLKELEAEMPKKLSYDETKKLVEETLSKFNEKPNKGMIMKLFKANINVDMAIASKIINEILK
ncbi:MAG: GatB/YqeY domain-containing protein [Alphaproteobacteria bacterium]|nr:GatB/YqeY domain-containing protein [Alphaproteobacteria bacterium]